MISSSSRDRSRSLSSRRYDEVEGRIMKDNPEGTLYFDHNATTPVCLEAVTSMKPYLTEEFGNPSSSYPLGVRAKEAVEDARIKIAGLLGSLKDEICFTSGGSESNNMVIKGIADLNALRGCHFITSAVEHPAVLNPLLYLMELGADVTIAPVDGSGRVDPDFIRRAIKPTTKLITVMLANNETGTIQPIREISRIAAETGIPLHTDAAQAVGKIPVDVKELGVDFLTVAGHKLYAPKGVGALYIKRGRSLVPLIHGAAQEMGRRAGTENVVLSVGLGEACREAEKRLKEDMDRIAELRDLLERLLREGIPDIVVNGHPSERLPNTLHVAVPKLEGARILAGIPRLMASTGAACHDRSVRLSHVLSAMGVPPEIGMGALRLSLGRGTTKEQVQEAAVLLIQQVRRMRGGGR
jgi:cysteine desulfurase